MFLLVAGDHKAMTTDTADPGKQVDGVSRTGPPLDNLDPAQAHAPKALSGHRAVVLLRVTYYGGPNINVTQ